ncbi:RluA family pseudouridine synthase [Gynuella sp.]|uniref:RluA family pseudouridine synthase n=1 Tax=Gynuella sp. TaxID=2969146 RepID=UPI003D0A8498
MQESLKLDVALEVELGDPLIAIEFLVENVNLSKSRLKDVMNKGAVWLQRGSAPKKRLRRAMSDLKVGDILELYYDEQLLSIRPPKPALMRDEVQYTVWHKPAGMLSQGNEWGDHTSLLRKVELAFNPKREVYLVHRLDREASGLIIIAHNRKAATYFNRLFQDSLIHKQYRIEVLGDLSQKTTEGTISAQIDGKDALTRFKFVKYTPENNSSKVDVWIETGRKHQIRRHFADYGYPVMGDPKYGKGNKNREGMKLSAVALEFPCPVQHQTRRISLYDTVRSP